MTALDRDGVACTRLRGTSYSPTAGPFGFVASPDGDGIGGFALLIVDAPEPYAAALRTLAARCGIHVFATSGEIAAVLGNEAVALCVVGVDGGVGVERVEALRKTFRGAAVVAIGKQLGVREVVRLMRLGATDVLPLTAPPDDIAVRCLAYAPRRLGHGESQELVGDCAAMRVLRRSVARVASTGTTVLVTGETGTGKGVVARTLHRLSDRAGAPFVHVDCTALSPTVIESELFGHERGAFTGAAARHAGRFERAAHGTIFLDEIGDLDATLQSKLLHVLQERAFERVGGERPLAMTARVIAATSRDLRRAVTLGHFRADLYFRLAVFQLEVPPLRDRIEDLPVMVHAILEQLSERLGIASPTVSDAFLERLAGHCWPGNVRELVNVLERALIEAGSEPLSPWHLADVLRSSEALAPPREPATPPSAPFGDARLDSPGSEREAIVAILSATGGNVSRTARRLQMPRSTLRIRIRDYQLGHLVPKD